MQSTNIQFIYHIIEKEQLPYFTIYNVNGATVYDYRDEDATPETARDALDVFLDMNKGVWKIKFRKTVKPPTGRAMHNYTYNINNMDSSHKKEQPVHGFADSGSSDDRFYQMLTGVLEENKQLRENKLVDTLNHLQENNRLQMELLQAQMKAEASKKDDSTTQLAIGALSALFGGGLGNQHGLAGFGDQPVAGDYSPAKLTAIEKAVQELMDIDPNFSENIQKLANLAKNNKAVYDMAISQLKNFS